MIQSNKDLYLNINKIINVLNNAGEVDFAKQIEDALSISTVPSEILGETRIVLKKLNSNTFIENLGIKKEVNISLDYLNKIL